MARQVLYGRLRIVESDEDQMTGGLDYSVRVEQKKK
jgi:hypothetical protein